MKFNTIAKPISRSNRRVGRGIAGGQGKTAGRGTKGQRSRSGGRLRPGFEGGQNPLMQRLPKQRGFTSRRRTAQLVHIDQLNRFSSSVEVAAQTLRAAGLISSLRRPIKVVSRGKLNKKLHLSGLLITKSARAQIEAQGGSVTAATKPVRPASQ